MSIEMFVVGQIARVGFQKIKEVDDRRARRADPTLFLRLQMEFTSFVSIHREVCEFILDIEDHFHGPHRDIDRIRLILEERHEKRWAELWKRKNVSYSFAVAIKKCQELADHVDGSLFNQDPMDDDYSLSDFTRTGRLESNERVSGTPSSEQEMQFLLAVSKLAALLEYYRKHRAKTAV